MTKRKQNPKAQAWASVFVLDFGRLNPYNLSALPYLLVTAMTTLLNILLIVSGIVFATTVMLMSPKGGLGFNLGGMNSTNEYGSKKSLEYHMKIVAYIAGISFVVLCVLYPYLNG